MDRDLGRRGGVGFDLDHGELAEVADDDDTADGKPSALSLIKPVPGNVSLESMLTEIG